MKVLIAGISGALGRMVAERCIAHGHDVIGLDKRPWPDAPKSVDMHYADIRKRPAEDLFRTQHPDAVIHMATVTHFTTPFEERYRINLNGTRAIFDHCHQYGVKHAIFVGRHTVYGAGPDTPLYCTEAEPPLAVSTFPELSDLVAADLFAGSALWRWPDLKTTVLRLVYTLGPTRRGTLAAFLAARRVPMIFGFDPLYHFMHEQDAVSSVMSALEHRPHGIFNVAGPQPIPLSVLCKVTGRHSVTLPEPLFAALSGRFGLANLPKGAVNHIKYPVVIDDTAFRKATGFKHDFDEVRTMESFRWAQ